MGAAAVWAKVLARDAWPRGMSPRSRGQAFEQQARRFLKQQGLVFVAANYASTAGEIDLIMRSGGVLVFVEVRMRQHAHHGGAVYSLSPAKRRRLRACIRHYLACHAPVDAWRVDFVIFQGEQATPRWFKSIPL